MILILLSGCSRQTAFEYFTRLDSRHERAVTQLRRVTLTEENRTVALINVLYLNPVDPEIYGKKPMFVVALFDRRQVPLEDYTVKLNGKVPAGMVRLDENCSLRSLMPLDNPWNVYYQLLFNKPKKSAFTLTFETDPFLKGEVTFDTDQ